MTNNIPEIILLCQDPSFITAFNNALRTRWPTHAPTKLKLAPINARLNTLPASTKFDLIVSPANSYGRLDGAFDDAISRTFSPRDDYHALTRAAQAVLYDKWRGFAPPGTCTLVELPTALKTNEYGCSWVAICPTMREPADVNWDREVVYECTWSLLCQVDGYNRGLGRKGGRGIRSVLMVPFAAGIGKVSRERWAAQTVLALKHFVEAVQEPGVWGSLQWDKISSVDDEVAATWRGAK